MTGRRTAQIAALSDLAALKRDRSAARLAKVQTLIDRLEAKADALRRAAPETPESIAENVVRDKWNRWRRQEIAVLNGQIARLHTIAQPQREIHARDVARKAVLDKLTGKRDGRG